MCLAYTFCRLRLIGSTLSIYTCLYKLQTHITCSKRETSSFYKLDSERSDEMYWFYNDGLFFI